MNAGTQPHTLAYTCRADTSCSHARLRVSMSPAGTGGTKDCMGTGTCAWGCDAGRRDAGPPKLKQRAHFGAEAMASGVGCLCMYTSPCAEQPSQVFFFYAGAWLRGGLCTDSGNNQADGSSWEPASKPRHTWNTLKRSC